MCAFAGSLINIVGFGIWQLAYTLPRWHELVLEPIAHAPSPLPGAGVAALYAAYALLVGVHTLAFWELMGTIGTVPAALSKGAMQAGVFLLAHLLFCHVDPTQCLTASKKDTGAWGHMQKPFSFAVCTIGCLVYACIKKKPVHKMGVTPLADADAAALPSAQQ